MPINNTARVYNITMKVLLTITLLFASLLRLTIVLPAENDTSTNASVNGTSAGTTHGSAAGWCHFNLGLVEYFPRGGTTGGRRAAIRLGPFYDNTSNLVTAFKYVTYSFLLSQALIQRIDGIMVNRCRTNADLTIRRSGSMICSALEIRLDSHGTTQTTTISTTNGWT
jgi:hypothetical protein